MKKLSLKVEKRKVFGRKVKKLRQEGVIPANIYGRNVRSEAVEVNSVDFSKVYKDAGETQVVYLELGGEKRPVLIHNVQKNPVTGELVHVDFLQIDLKEKVTASIGVVGVGESPAEKQGLGTIVFYTDEIEVEALPTDLPEKLEVDLSSIKEINQVILVKDLNIDMSKINVRTNPDEIVVKLEPFEEEKEEAAAEVAGEAATTGDSAQEENQQTETSVQS
jgi:large subunit ribosomal protein L25